MSGQSWGTVADKQAPATTVQDGNMVYTFMPGQSQPASIADKDKNLITQFSYTQDQNGKQKVDATLYKLNADGTTGDKVATGEEAFKQTLGNTLLQ